MKRILVTTDFSELGDEALAPAADLARRLGASLTLAHVVAGERPPGPEKGAPYYQVAQRLFEADSEMEDQALQALKARVADLEGVEAEPAVARGAAIAGILAVAKETQADLIVLSSQGRTGLSRILLGSVAEELARRSPVPVLIWKSGRGK